ncbi:MAG: hypothetical protein M1826_004043 [Phylliscum demangeonii]|nr:MAG: hypothetical protein M1826_004043 [Phylliscum demangeonii]
MSLVNVSSDSLDAPPEPALGQVDVPSSVDVKHNRELNDYILTQFANNQINYYNYDPIIYLARFCPSCPLTVVFKHCNCYHDVAMNQTIIIPPPLLAGPAGFVQYGLRLPILEPSRTTIKSVTTIDHCPSCPPLTLAAPLPTTVRSSPAQVTAVTSTSSNNTNGSKKVTATSISALPLATSASGFSPSSSLNPSAAAGTQTPRASAAAGLSAGPAAGSDHLASSPLAFPPAGAAPPGMAIAAGKTSETAAPMGRHSD